MGMDVYGRNQAYFRASIWRWPALLQLIHKANQDSNLELDLKGWQWNDGCGLDTQEDCNALADALEKIVFPCKASVVFAAGNNDDGTHIGLALASTLGLNVTFEVDLGHVKEFISFLRNCGGGFSIW